MTCPRANVESLSYRLKTISFLGRSLPIICQNENGPCPLLAICNVLLLRGHISLSTDYATVSSDELIQIVANRLLETNPPLENKEMAVSQEKNLDDVISLLPRLLDGLDVNVRFCSVNDFEFTTECCAFDLLDMRLVHGWLLDHQDNLTAAVVRHRTYNELVEALVEYRSAVEIEKSRGSADAAPMDCSDLPANQDKEIEQSSLPEQNQSGKEGDSQSFMSLGDINLESIEVGQLDVRRACIGDPMPVPGNLDIKVESCNVLTDQTESKQVVDETTTLSKGANSPSKANVTKMMIERQMSSRSAFEKLTTILREGPVIEDFLNSTASQLTYYGLVKLHEEITERQCCVFFRNNHFSTMFKYENDLYLLVTDAGYCDEVNVIWEKLSQIDGDTEYFDADFKALVASSSHQHNMVAPANHGGQAAFNERDDSDYILALRLQEEENQAVSASQARETVGFDVRQGYGTGQSTLRPADEGTRQDMPLQSDNIEISTAGQILVSDEQLKAQIEAERYFKHLHDQRLQDNQSSARGVSTAQRQSQRPYPSQHHHQEERDKNSCAIQ